MKTRLKTPAKGVVTSSGLVGFLGEGSAVESENGASEGIRTLDIHVGNVMLYQLSYARIRRSWDNKRTAAAGKPEFQELTGSPIVARTTLSR